MTAPRRTPQDRRPKASAPKGVLNDDGTYDWTSAAGITVHVPPMNDLSAGFIRANRRRTEHDFIFTVLEELLDEDELKNIDRLGLSDVNRLFIDWAAAAGVSIPQS